MSIYADSKKHLKGGVEIPVSSQLQVFSIVPNQEFVSNSTVPAIVIDKSSGDLFDPFGRNIFYISDIHLFHHLVMAYPIYATDNQIKKFVHEFVKDMLTSEFRINGKYLLIGGDVSHSFALSSLFYNELKLQLDELSTMVDNLSHHKRIFEVYAVLGNHELWDFHSLQECEGSYHQLLESLGFHLLCNEEVPFSINKPEKLVELSDNKQIDGRLTFVRKFIDPQKEPDTYDKGLIKKGNLIIVGGVGFAGCNEVYNANKGLYRKTLNRTQEINESKKWANVYLHALEDARKLRGQLIVITHNPIEDWMGPQFNGDANCIYFTGHTHKNSLYHDDEHNIHIYGNNQIGYNGKINLKRAYVYSRGNPFAKYSDGIYEITSNDYIEFYGYIDERLQGNGTAERMINDSGCKFYMIKKNGYYGFFLVSDKASYICAGGHVIKINIIPDINYINDNFEFMVNTYLQGLSPYRQAQENISEIVRKMGGTGVIHGCIVDINFFNHIMVNPNDGTLTYYYSPDFGQVMTYNSVAELLQKHAPELLGIYMKNEPNAFALYKPVKNVSGNKLITVSRSDGMYGLSNKVNQVQRLFTCKVLRAWNDELIREQIQNKTY